VLKSAVHELIENKNLSEKQMMNAVEEIMEGRAQPSLVGSFLTALKLKGATIQEITGGAKVMRDKAEKINLDDLYTLDTCGTGGDKSGTFNISTAVSFVSAAAGAFIVKHGNRSVSSKSGSADVLEALGVNINLNPQQIEGCVRDQNMGFLFAPIFHNAMKYAAGVRKDLGFRTVFNILGPLTNPAKAKSQVLGVFDEKLTETMAQVLRNLGVERALVVHGMDGLDEISICEETKITELSENGIKTYFISPEDFGLKRSKREDILGGTAEENADIIKDIFKGEKGAKRDILLLNSGAALYVSKKVDSIKEGIDMSAELIDSGRVLEKMNEYIQYTRRLV
jgi:anthranilate phosphoribosyltransferase